MSVTLTWMCGYNELGYAPRNDRVCDPQDTLETAITSPYAGQSIFRFNKRVFWCLHRDHSRGNRRKWTCRGSGLHLFLMLFFLLFFFSFLILVYSCLLFSKPFPSNNELSDFIFVLWYVFPLPFSTNSLYHFMYNFKGKRNGDYIPMYKISYPLPI